jgi:hypothetical protein
MSSLKRFYTLGADAADRRVASVLQPPPLDGTDRYLKESAFVTTVDRITLRLQTWWLASEASHFVASIRQRASRQSAAIRHRAVGLMILIAVAVHMSLTLMLGTHTGWFWLILPAIAALFAAGVLAGSRSTD